MIVAVAVGGYSLALPSPIDPVRLAILALSGATASFGAAMLNHYLDRDLDRTMARTQHRPLADGRVRSERGVAAAGLVLSAVGVGAATVLLNPLTGVSILLGGVTYVLIYTAWLKRRSSWNIVIGGFAGSAPVLAGSAAAVGGWTPAAIAFAVLVFFWTPPHFWSLAVLLRDDYRRAGLPMLPRMDDLAYSGRVIVVSTLALFASTGALVATGTLAWPIAVVALALGATFVGLTAPMWKGAMRRAARRGFFYSGPYLLALVVAVIINWPLVGRGVGGW